MHGSAENRVHKHEIVIELGKGTLFKSPSQPKDACHNWKYKFWIEKKPIDL